MKKIILALFAIVNTACAHPHYVVPPPRPYVYSPPPVVYYDYGYSGCSPYYNNWNRWNCYPPVRPFCVSPGFGYGFSFNNGRSFGRVWVR